MLVMSQKFDLFVLFFFYFLAFDKWRKSTSGEGWQVSESVDPAGSDTVMEQLKRPKMR